MRLSLRLLACLLGLAFLPGAEAVAQPPAPLHFETKQIEGKLDIGYAVLLADIDGDGKKDIVVVDTHRVVWYQNPTWKLRTILSGKTARDNVCIAPADIDGDGKLDLALGAGWRPFNTKSGGTLQWLRRGKNLDEEWTLFPIAEEPMLHRIRFADIDGTGKPALLSAPLMGRNSTREKNWMDGAPVRLTAYRIPKDPTRERWVPEVIDESLHVMHNFYPIPPLLGRGKGAEILTASYEGVHLLYRDGEKWKKVKLGEGNQDNPKGSRGASEIKLGWLGRPGLGPKERRPFIATIEPWHGNQVVVYTPGPDLAAPWKRHVLDDQLKWGHAVWCADLDGDGRDELVIGVRDDLEKSTPGKQCGVRIYTALDREGTKWSRQLVDEGGVAVEDLAVADLDGDGKPDIVAVGRATKNARVYRNLGRKKE